VRIRCIGLSVALLVGFAGWADAQTCAGGAPISNQSRMVVGPALAFQSGVASYAAAVGGGSDTWAMGGHAGVVHYDTAGFTSYALGFQGGGQVAADARRRIMVCPVAQFGYEWKNNLADTGIDMSAFVTGAGVRTGFVVAESATAQLVPTMGLSVNRLRAEFKDSIESIVLTNTYGVLHLGAGVVLNQRMAITPAVNVPFALEGADTTFSLAFAYGFGRR
jgi:hypothetical protein